MGPIPEKIQLYMKEGVQAGSMPATTLVTVAAVAMLLDKDVYEVQDKFMDAGVAYQNAFRALEGNYVRTNKPTMENPGQ